MAEIPRWTVTEPYLNLHCALGEGPFYEASGHRLRFVDIKKHQIHIVDLAAGPASLRTIQLDIPVGVTANIAGVDPSEKILIAAKSGIAVLDMRTERYTYLRKFLDVEDHAVYERLRSNDGAVDPQGRFWLGTMNDFPVGAPQPEGTLFRFDSDLTRHTMLTSLTIPNGLGWSLDHKTMYFVNSTEAIVFAYDYDAPTGSISNPRPLWKLTSGADPDGFAMDKHGYLWQAIYGEGRVVRISPEGKIVGQIDLPTRCITCPVFVGTELFITCASEEDPDKHPESVRLGGALFRVEVGVEGLPKNEFKLEKAL